MITDLNGKFRKTEIKTNKTCSICTAIQMTPESISFSTQIAHKLQLVFKLIKYLTILIYVILE